MKRDALIKKRDPTTSCRAASCQAPRFRAAQERKHKSKKLEETRRKDKASRRAAQPERKRSSIDKNASRAADRVTKKLKGKSCAQEAKTGEQGKLDRRESAVQMERSDDIDTDS